MAPSDHNQPGVVANIFSPGERTLLQRHIAQLLQERGTSRLKIEHYFELMLQMASPTRKIATLSSIHIFIQRTALFSK